MPGMYMKIAPSGWLARGVFLLSSIGLILGGVAALSEGRLHYSNYWGGAVFAPLAIVFGLVILAVTTVKWPKFSRPNDAPKLKGKAARLARQAEQAKFPIDDYEKW